MSSLEPLEMDGLTQDDFLGGRLSLLQPKTGYRAGLDPVLLAASIEAEPGDSVLDLGCGVGTAALCVARRLPATRVTGLEVQSHYAALARRNAEINGISLDVVTGDVTRMPPRLTSQQFQHVLVNPPYFDRAKSTPAPADDKEHALGEGTPLGEWVHYASKRTAAGGTVTFIHRTDRLPDLLWHFSQGLGSLEVRPIAARINKRPRMVLLRGRKGGRAEFRLHLPWILHDGEAHDGDRQSFTPLTNAILRDGAPLPFC